MVTTRDVKATAIKGMNADVIATTGDKPGNVVSEDTLFDPSVIRSSISGSTLANSPDKNSRVRHTNKLPSNAPSVLNSQQCTTKKRKQLAPIFLRKKDGKGCNNKTQQEVDGKKESGKGSGDVDGGNGSDVKVDGREWVACMGGARMGGTDVDDVHELSDDINFKCASVRARVRRHKIHKFEKQYPDVVLLEQVKYDYIRCTNGRLKLYYTGNDGEFEIDDDDIDDEMRAEYKMFRNTVETDVSGFEFVENEPDYWECLRELFWDPVEYVQYPYANGWDD